MALPNAPVNTRRYVDRAKLAWRVLSTSQMSNLRYRAFFELQRRTGVLRKKFPTNCNPREFLSLAEWRTSAPKFFFQDRSDVRVPRVASDALRREFDQFQRGNFRFFSASYLPIGRNYDWISNPLTGHRYDIQKHWTEVPDFSPNAGDIKYCWEKSRFSYLYTLIRYDHHFGEDCAELVFQEIESWIAANPINRGPNYRCSQEIGLRVMNWTFALYYYKNSHALSEARFAAILHSVYWQLHHVYHNIGFSLNCVRNNHAITESLVLYLAGLLFPFFPEAERWSTHGKAWFEREVEYQVAHDGTFVQHSHNYHRVLVQLLTWALSLSRIHGNPIDGCVVERAKSTTDYLVNAIDSESGFLPNYGLNDGALFFPLNDCHYRDYRPQLNALAKHLFGTPVFEGEGVEEDAAWLSPSARSLDRTYLTSLRKPLRSFSHGGIYTIRDEDSFLFVHCASFRDRPYQADNLHLDFWYQGVNFLRDAGSYLYNTDEKWMKYFNGTSSHNTVSLGSHDQMLKGPRFLWFYWSRSLSADLSEETDGFRFTGEIEAFRQLAAGIRHRREVFKRRTEAEFVVQDSVQHSTGLPVVQYWNTNPAFQELFRISAQDETGKQITPEIKEGHFSERYGEKERTDVIVFQTHTKRIRTVIAAL